MSYQRRGKAKARRRFIKESMHKSLREGSSVLPPLFPEKFRHEIELKPSTDPPQKKIRLMKFSKIKQPTSLTQGK